MSIHTKPSLRITLAQINTIVGDVSGNTEKIINVIKNHKNKSDLIVFPELTISGYQPEDLILQNSFMNVCHAAIKKIVPHTLNAPAIIVGCPWLEEDKRYNAALCIAEGEIKNIIYKYHLPNYGVFDEKRVFDKGNLPTPFDFKGYKLGVAICEDFWFPDVADHLQSQGSELLISINGSPFLEDKRLKRLNVINHRVSETELPIIYVNMVGGQDDIVYDGGSFALNEKGHFIFHAMYCYEDIETIEFPFTQTIDYEPPENNRILYNVLKLGLRDYVEKNDFKGILLGLSGGIDSAISAVIAVEALGADKVSCVMMPSPYTSQESLDDAAALAQKLGCDYQIIPIHDVMESFNSTLNNPTGIAAENIQSRARGMILMALSNQTGKMVLTTGNKSEMAVGYATLYGDMCGGFNVLKDVYKTRVYELSNWINRDEEIIPTNIITRPASAELRPNQTDQDSLPAYDVLDAILYHLVEQRLGVSDIIAKGFDAQTVEKIQKLLNKSEYKRRQSAPGIKTTEVAFGRDRRMPIINLDENA